MTEITNLREIQLLELGILQHLADICRKHGIRFFLSNGTLLGAVKYGKFIPWDDDVDILMPRADYDCLMHLPDIDTACYRLFSQERMPAWRLPFAKLCDMRTEKRETSANFGLPTGLDIDIFPIDVWSGGERQARRCGLWRRGVSAAVEDHAANRLEAAGAPYFLVHQPLLGEQILLPTHRIGGAARAGGEEACVCGLRRVEPVWPQGIACGRGVPR